MSRTVFVAGTDTGVGKTVVAAALCAEAAERGSAVGYAKPAQTGVGPDEPGDAAFVAAVAGVRGVEGVRFEAPLAPAVAAALEERPVDVDALLRLVEALRDGHELVVVEGAGGLLVPLSDDVDMAAYAARLGAELLVVTRPTLGTLNHTALTVEAARRRGLEPTLVVSGWPSRPGVTERTNLDRLARMAPIVGVVPRVAGLDVDSQEAPSRPVIDRSILDPRVPGPAARPPERDPRVPRPAP